MPNITQIVRSAGTLYLNPTDLSDPSGYGTNLGYTKSGILEYINPEFFYSVNEEFGNNIWRKFYLGNRCQVLVLLRNFNADTMAASFPGQSAGGGYQLTGSLTPGTLMNDYTVKLIFIPKNLNYPCIYMRRAAVHIFPKTAIRTGHSFYTSYPMLIDNIPSSPSDSSYYQKKVIGNIIL